MHGRLFLHKGDKPYTTKDITDKLCKQWKTKCPWQLISLGRGFYEFSFTSDDDMRNSLALGTVNLKPGLLRLSRWSKDFNKYSHRLTHAQVWLRLLDLPQEYWLERTLMEIAGAIGAPLIIDAATQKHTFSHYARVLVDIDFSRRLFYEITVEREGYAFPVEVEYEWLPDFCTHCQILNKDSNNANKVQDKGKQLTFQQKPQQTKQWQPLENPHSIGSSIAFEQPPSVSAARVMEIMVPIAVPEQSPEQHIPTISDLIVANC